jgi:serine/threonine protein kinase
VHISACRARLSEFTEWTVSDEAGQPRMQVIVPVLVVLHHMHCSGIMHRHVNPGAIQFHETGAACVGAFDLAVRVCDVNCAELEGPIDFAAPEMLLCSAYDGPVAQESSDSLGSWPPGSVGPGPGAQISYSYSVDVWALGVTVYLCLTGQVPFTGSDSNPDLIYDNIFFSEPDFPQGMNAAAKDFIQQCLRKQPSERPDVRDLLSHPFVRDHIGWVAAINERLPDELYRMPEVSTPGYQVPSTHAERACAR